MHHGIGHMVRGRGEEDQVTTPPPGTRSQHLPPQDQVTIPPPRDQVITPPRDQVTTPPPPRTRSQHLPPPTPSPGTMHRWAVRILLECILVYLYVHLHRFVQYGQTWHHPLWFIPFFLHILLSSQ